ncbi:hypothetical protein BN979_00001 [Mycolicibacterium vulneris]|nr:hypothetical protein BN979_00001 [Mycolicibacterium vulneris]
MFLAVAQPVEELVGTQTGGVSVFLAVRLEFLGRPGEQQPVQRGLPFGSRRGQQCLVGDREFLDRLGRPPALKCLGAQRFRPTTRRVPEFATQEPDHAVGDVVLGRIRGELGRADPSTDQRQRQIADHLRRGGHLHQPAQHPIGGGIGGLDLLEPVPQPQGDGLLTQVAQLPTGNLVGIHPPGRRREAGFERRVDLAQRLPIGLQIAHRVQRQAGVERRVRGGGHDRGQRRLTGGPGQRRRGTIDRAGAGLPGRQIRRQLPARGVVGVHMHRQIKPAA